MLRRAYFAGHGPSQRKLLTISRRWSSTKQHDPLRILFCGADQFSIFSLRALQDFKQQQPEKVASIDVVCRPDKRVGRGLKRVQEVPIKPVATELGLNLHQLDTFKEWRPPSVYDLVVTVSFGLLVPAKVLNAAQYGGLNVHPSLLPQFRGPAPIQRAMLSKAEATGVTLQTMHPTRFDHGQLLSRSDPLLSPWNLSMEEATRSLGMSGARLLVDAIRDGTFVPPIQDLELTLKSPKSSYAAKITPEDRRIDWEKWTSEDIILRDRVLGNLWDTSTFAEVHRVAHEIATPSALDQKSKEQGGKRIIYHGPWTLSNEEHTAAAPGRPSISLSSRGPHEIALQTVDRGFVKPASMTIEGERRGTGQESLYRILRKQQVVAARDNGTGS
ncbi:hypothetical protein LTR62_005620 [Meristemomyces frigidus]|uniref:methionyl-tRNA formyltransferase n=1 Tax=Meristemomyces frigidus TaxID=1508187 RepID=A0AAN7YNE3_9PEZI|nr:hypothetical protein LTR62_005620 [Meristemomyces frigidus]